MVKFVCPLIVVTDINRSKIFYTELLEQTIKFDFGKNVVFNGDFAIHDLNHFKELIENREVIKQSNNFELYFENDNVDSIAMRLKNDKVEFIHELKTQPWQQRVIRFYDPDMHIIEIGESMENVCRRLYTNSIDCKKIAELTSLPLEFVEKAINEIKEG